MRALVESRGRPRASYFINQTGEGPPENSPRDHGRIPKRLRAEGTRTGRPRDRQDEHVSS